MKMTLSYHYLAANLNILEQLGFPKDRALGVLNLDAAALQIASNRVSLDSFLNCINAASDFTSDPNIALRLGHKFRVGKYGHTGNLYAYCKNLREVIAMNDRYQKLAIDAGYAKYMVDPLGGHHMCFQPYYTDMEKYRPITDLIMATYGTTYRWLTWGLGEDILSTHLPYPKPKETLAHEEIFHSDVIYGSEHCCLEFSEAGMFDPLTTHNAERLSRVKIKLDKLLGLQMTTQSFEDAVEAAIRGAIESGQVSSHIVAERLGLSWSDLRTKLNETGRSFRPRLDQIRKTMFIEKYETGKSFSQIAMSLAYNDQAAMNRAFRRWFGMTPSDWRRRQAQEKL